MAPAATATPEADAPVLMEVPARERALAQLKSTFEAVNANEHGHANKRELYAALENDHRFVELLKEAEMQEKWPIMQCVLNHETDYISWGILQDFAMKVVHEVKESEMRAAEELAAEERVLQHLQELFLKLAADEDGTVLKHELEAMLAKEEAAIKKVIEGAVINPCWNIIAPLDTNKDGRIAWEEFKAYITSVAEEAKESEEIVEHAMSTQRCFGCC